MKKLFVAVLAIAALAACNKEEATILNTSKKSVSMTILNGGEATRAITNASDDENFDKYDSVVRIASKKDYLQHLKNQEEEKKALDKSSKKLSKLERERLIEELTKEMKAASAKLEFEQAAFIRDKIKELRNQK